MIQLQVQHAEPVLSAQSVSDGVAKHKQRKMNHAGVDDDDDDANVDDGHSDSDGSNSIVASLDG